MNLGVRTRSFEYFKVLAYNRHPKTQTQTPETPKPYETRNPKPLKPTHLLKPNRPFSADSLPGAPRPLAADLEQRCCRRRDPGFPTSPLGFGVLGLIGFRVWGLGFRGIKYRV